MVLLAIVFCWAAIMRVRRGDFPYSRFGVFNSLLDPNEFPFSPLREFAANSLNCPIIFAAKRQLRGADRQNSRFNGKPVARAITGAVPIPTIGIGASPACDGQILVTDDVLGVFTEFKPRFVKRYAELAPLIAAAAEAYAAEVRARRFPGPEHCFGAK